MTFKRTEQLCEREMLESNLKCAKEALRTRLDTCMSTDRIVLIEEARNSEAFII